MSMPPDPDPYQSELKPPPAESSVPLPPIPTQPPQQQQQAPAQAGWPGYPPQSPGWPGYPPQPAGYYPAQPQTNGLAIASMVLGIFWLYWIGSILALIFGYRARKQIRERQESGGGMATAGIVLGWVGIGLGLLGVIAAVAANMSY